MVCNKYADIYSCRIRRLRLSALVRDLREGEKKQEEQKSWVWEVIKTKKKKENQLKLCPKKDSEFINAGSSNRKM